MNSREPSSPPVGPLAPVEHLGRAAALSLCLCWPWASVVALEGDQEQPVYIEADSVELDDIQHTSVYIGNVQIDQGTMRILADQVTVKHKEDRRPRLIVALGNPVRYRQDVEGQKGEVKAHAQRMEYDAEKDELTLIDQAELTQATDRFASDRIVYDRARSQVKAGTSAQGSGRVRITFTPEKEPDAKTNGATKKATGAPPGRTPRKEKVKP
jgi:lipopolysaccharide export system protein LptA